MKKTTKFSTLSKKLGTFRGITQLEARRGGHTTNQFIAQFKNGQVFQSYSTIIGVKMNGKIYLTPAYDCSKTTMYYTDKWLDMKISDIRKKLFSGEFSMMSFT